MPTPITCGRDALASEVEMTTERGDETDFEPRPGEAVDPIRAAVSQLIVAVMAAIPEGPTRAHVVTEVLGLHARVVALLSRRSLN
jgi:hypothetical protein